MENFITKILYLPPVASEHGPEIDKLMFYIHLLMFVLFVGWGAFFLYTLWRFKRRRMPAANPVGVRGHMSTYLEVGVAVIEGVLLVGLAIPLWARGASIENFPEEEESTLVRVIGRQFNWIAHYPGPDGAFGRADQALLSAENFMGLDPDDPNGADDIVTQNSEVVVPLGKPVIAQIGSLDVIHCFAVRQMRITQDAIPGLSIPVWFKPTHAGTYQITCAQLCGNGHSQMRGLLKVVEPEAYEAWLNENSAPVSYE